MIVKSHIFNEFAIHDGITGIHIGKIYFRMIDARLLHSSFKTDDIRFGYIILQRFKGIRPLSLPMGDLPFQLVDLVLVDPHILFQLVNLEKQIGLLLSPTTLLIPKVVYLHNLGLKAVDLRLKLAHLALKHFDLLQIFLSLNIFHTLQCSGLSKKTFGIATQASQCLKFQNFPPKYMKGKIPNRN